MNANKIWSFVILVVMVVITSFTFSSCSDDEPQKPFTEGSSLAGTSWKIVEGVYDRGGYDKKVVGETVTFHSNGYLTYYPELPENGEFKWKQEGMTLTIYTYVSGNTYVEEWKGTIIIVNETKIKFHFTIDGKASSWRTYTMERQ